MAPAMQWVDRMPASANELRERTKRFAFDIIDLVKGLPRNIATDAIARQLIRAGTGVSSNHRAAGRARSRREFIARLAIVVEEADEAELWLEALLKCRLAPASAVEPLYVEASELRAIFVKSLQTARTQASLQAATTRIVG
jgi:four helix bundle protein